LGGKKIIEQKVHVLIFSTNFVRNISHSKKNLARYDHKYILGFMQSILSDFNETFILLTDTQISDFMKIHPVRAELFHADRQTWQG